MDKREMNKTTNDSLLETSKLKLTLTQIKVKIKRVQNEVHKPSRQQFTCI